MKFIDRAFLKLNRRISNESVDNDCFEYNGKILHLFQHNYNCGSILGRMTERCLEMAIAIDWFNRTSGDVYEIGATSPYYIASNSRICGVCDPADKHNMVTEHCSMFDLDLKGKNVLSISTIEHINTGEYGNKIELAESAVGGFEKIVKESKACLITFPANANKELDEYFSNQKYLDVELRPNEQLLVTFYVRGTDNNSFKIDNVKKVKDTPYGPRAANGVVVIEKASS